MLIVTILAIAGSGCNNTDSVDNIRREKGVVSVSVAVPRAITQGSVFAVDLSNGQSTLHTEQHLSGPTATAVLTGVFVGFWDVNAYIQDADGNKTHEGSGKVLVNAGATSVCSLKLSMVKGILQVNVAKDNLSSGVAYGRLKLGVGSEYTSNLRSDIDAGGSLAFSIPGLAPTTYQYKIELYDATDHLLYTSPSELVEVLPGRLSPITWAPPVGQVSVEGSVDTSPEAPQGVRASIVGGRLDISWDPVFSDENDLQGYQIYRKSGDLGSYESVGIINYDKTVFSINMLTPGTYYYRVSCYDLNGNESSWSEEVKVTI